MNREELLKNAKPILFNTEMVQAILEGRKTVTRRVVKPQPRLQNPLELKCDGFEQREHEKGTNKWNEVQYNYLGEKFYSYGRTASYKVGDILYVRETWQRNYCNDVIVTGKYAYRASPKTWQYFSEEEKNLKKKWKPSIHMPKEAARIFLKVTDVRVERLQDITEEDAIAEGMSKTLVDGVVFISAKGNFHVLWDSLNIKRGYGWEDNPWVWVIEFERVEVENE